MLVRLYLNFRKYLLKSISRWLLPISKGAGSEELPTLSQLTLTCCYFFGLIVGGLRVLCKGCWWNFSKFLIREVFSQNKQTKKTQKQPTHTQTNTPTYTHTYTCSHRHSQFFYWLRTIFLTYFGHVQFWCYDIYMVTNATFFRAKASAISRRKFFSIKDFRLNI